MSYKLYLVTRQDLPPGQQAVQACHAMTEFLIEHKNEAKLWHDTSNYLALLSVPDEQSLCKLVDKAHEHDLCLSLFHEFDRDGELTAVAFESRAKQLLRNVKLAFSSV